MRNFVTAIKNRDSNALSRMAGDGPQPTGKGVHEGIEKLVDTLFTNLKPLFPASVSTVLRDPAGEATAKRQWIAAFAENGIITRQQLAAGMKRARSSESAFWPSPGKFIAWCHEGALLAAGLPDQDALYEMVMNYCRNRGLYNSAEDYPWQNNACYWMVTGLYSMMRAQGLSEAELRVECRSELRRMSDRLKAREDIPPPRKQIPTRHHPLSNEKGLSKIAELRRKHGLLATRKSS